MARLFDPEGRKSRELRPYYAVHIGKVSRALERAEEFSRIPCTDRELHVGDARKDVGDVAEQPRSVFRAYSASVNRCQEGEAGDAWAGSKKALYCSAQ